MQNNLLLVISNRMISNLYTLMLAAMFNIIIIIIRMSQQIFSIWNDFH